MGVPDPSRLSAALAAVSSERIAARVRELAAIGGSSDGGVSRLGLTKEEQAAREMVASWLIPLGFKREQDAACNLFCSAGPSPRVLIGSHLDSVPDGGRYDGSLGVVTAVEVAEAAHAARLALPLEIVAWSAEEGARYRAGHFGSAATFGQLPPDVGDRELRDGNLVKDAIRDLIGRAPDLAGCRRPITDFIGYLELHIEQGPRLASQGLPVGVVTGIVGMTRATLLFTGRADHSGTTPMDARSDALAAAAECVLAVERVGRESGGQLVGTVGELRVFPGSANVVPGGCRLTIEVRSLSDATQAEAYGRILELTMALCDQRGIRCAVEVVDRIPATAMSQLIVAAIEESCARLGVPAMRLSSGAGHDAQNVVTAGVQGGMVFVRSTEGSHNPKEHADAEDAAAGTRIVLSVADAIARLGARR
jgi:allantoate deiminase